MHNERGYHSPYQPVKQTPQTHECRPPKYLLSVGTTSYIATNHELVELFEVRSSVSNKWEIEVKGCGLLCDDTWWLLPAFMKVQSLVLGSVIFGLIRLRGIRRWIGLRRVMRVIFKFGYTIRCCCCRRCLGLRLRCCWCGFRSRHFGRLFCLCFQQPS